MIRLSPAAPDIVVREDLAGWSADLPADAFAGIEALIAVFHFGMGAMFVGIGASGLWAADTGPGGVIFLPFAAVGSVFVGWPLLKLARAVWSFRLLLRGGQLRVTTRFVGLPVRTRELALADCGDAGPEGSGLRLAGRVLPTGATAASIERLARSIREASASSLPVALPPVPDALREITSAAPREDTSARVDPPSSEAR